LAEVRTVPVLLGLNCVEQDNAMTRTGRLHEMTCLQPFIQQFVQETSLYNDAYKNS